MTTFTEMPKYAAYKDSGVDWLGEIPEEWSTRKVKYLFRIGRGRVISQQELDDNGCYPVYSSQTQNDGILGYISTFDFDCEQITWTTDGANAGTVFLRKGKHNCTNVCGTLQPINKQKISLEFLKNALSIAAQFYKRPDTNGAKIMNGEMAEIFVTFPPLEAQTAIANFLDEKTAKIDEAIAIKEKQIELLKERKQIIIQLAVTQGLDLTVPMKDSGVDWMGQIPAHWDIENSKWLFSLRREKAKKDDVQLTASQKYGVIPQQLFMELEGRRVTQVEFNSEILKHVESGDFVISMRSFQGGIEYCSYIGSVSSAYVALIPTDKIYSPFFKYLLKCNRYIEALQSTSNLVRDGQALRYENFCMVPLPVIPIKEQVAISNYIDQQIIKIESAVELLFGQVITLKEYRTTLINSAVTGKIKVV